MFEDYKKSKLRATWDTPNWALVPESFLVFTVDDAFSDPPKVACRLTTPEPKKLQGRNLWISGLHYTTKDEVSFSPVRRERGNLDDGNFRYVYEYVGAESGLPFRAGLTVHASRGTWSSYPSHFHETVSVLSPVNFYPDFEEVFAIMTDNPYGWGTIFRGTHENLGIAVVKDGSIIDVPLGPHPIVAAPGTRIAYVWVYLVGSPGRNAPLPEKFEGNL